MTQDWWEGLRVFVTRTLNFLVGKDCRRWCADFFDVGCNSWFRALRLLWMQDLPSNRRGAVLCSTGCSNVEYKVTRVQDITRININMDESRVKSVLWKSVEALGPKLPRLGDFVS